MFNAYYSQDISFRSNDDALDFYFFMLLYRLYS